MSRFTEDQIGVIRKVNLSSYIAFCTNANATSLDAAFGKNNESVIEDLGKQIAMYSWFTGTNKISYPFTNTLYKATFAQIVADPISYVEVYNELNAYNLTQVSSYAQTLYNDDVNLKNITCYYAGLTSGTYANCAALIASQTAMATIYTNAQAFALLLSLPANASALAANSAESLRMFSSQTAINTMLSSVRIMTGIEANATAFRVQALLSPLKKVNQVVAINGAARSAKALLLLANGNSGAGGGSFFAAINTGIANGESRWTSTSTFAFSSLKGFAPMVFTSSQVYSLTCDYIEATA